MSGNFSRIDMCFRISLCYHIRQRSKEGKKRRKTLCQSSENVSVNFTEPSRGTTSFIFLTTLRNRTRGRMDVEISLNHTHISRTYYFFFRWCFFLAMNGWNRDVGIINHDENEKGSLPNQHSTPWDLGLGLGIITGAFVNNYISDVEKEGSCYDYRKLVYINLINNDKVRTRKLKKIIRGESSSILEKKKKRKHTYTKMDE